MGLSPHESCELTESKNALALPCVPIGLTQGWRLWFMVSRDRQMRPMNRVSWKLSVTPLDLEGIFLGRGPGVNELWEVAWAAQRTMSCTFGWP